MSQDIEQRAYLMAAAGNSVDEISSKTGLTKQEATEIWQELQKAKDGAENLAQSSKE